VGAVIDREPVGQHRPDLPEHTPQPPGTTIELWFRIPAMSASG
jgi:hypothetical protein